MKRVWAWATVLVLPLLVAPPLAGLLPWPFHRIFTRVLLVTALAALALAGAFRRPALRRSGLGGDPRWLSGLATGALVGGLALVVFYGTALGFGPVRWTPREQAFFTWVVKLTGTAATAAAVGLAEEFLFRGLLFGSLRRWWSRRSRSVWPAAVAASAGFALLHFSALEPPPISGTPTAFDGLAILVLPFRALANVTTLWPALAGLFLFGLGLSATVVRTGSLFVAIGAHASIVFVVRASRMFVRFPGDADVWWGSNKVYDGVAGWILLGLLTVTLVAWRRRESTSSVEVPQETSDALE